MDVLIKQFPLESDENLGRLASEPVKLETNSSSHGLFSSVFRISHAIKGSRGFLGFSKVE